MKKSMKWKILLIIIVIVFSVQMFLPLKEKINLGLDIKGGIHLRMKVIASKAIEMQTDQVIAQLKNRFNQDSIKFEKMSKKDVNRIEISGILLKDRQKIEDNLDDDFREWNYVFAGTQCTVSLKPNIEIRLKDLSVNQALETIRNRIDQFGVTEPVLQKESGETLLIQLPGVNEKEKTRIMELIGSTAMLEFKPVVAGPFDVESKDAAIKAYGNPLADDMVILRTSPKLSDEKGYFILKAASVFTGKDLKNARRGKDENGFPSVNFTLNSQGANKIEKFSAANIGKRLSIILDSRVISAPAIRGVLSYSNQISGSFTVEKADDLAVVLRSGALPAPLEHMEERIIGASLGDDLRKKGIRAALIGLILVIAFMLFFYKGAGINSVVAVLLNIVILLGILAYLKATLTLPGIAGIILTIGMAVDANVLIFERIKEDLRAGKAPKTAIDSGFKKAFLTIFDANLTTIIAAIFLFQFGTGPIKGFSVTLIIGITASMFTALFVSRVIFDLVYGTKKKLKKISI